MLIQLNQISAKPVNMGIVPGKVASARLPKFKENAQIKIVDDGTSVYSNTYFLGLLQPILAHFTNSTEFKENIDISDLRYDTKAELLRAVTRHYDKR